MNFIKRALHFLKDERGQFGIPPSRLALSPGEVLQDEARRREEVMQREQMERQFALAQRRITAQQQATEMQQAVRTQQYGLQRDIAAERVGQQREQFEKEMEARRTGEFFAERAPTREPTKPASYREWELAGSPGTFEEWKKPTKVTTAPSWGEKQFIKSFQDTFAIGESLTTSQAAKAKSRVDKYNKMAKKWGFDEVFIEKYGVFGTRRRLAIKEAMAPAREGGVFAADSEVEKIEERVKPPEQLKIWETGAKEDRYGYRMGEAKMARDGTMMEYVGNDKWLPLTR